MLTKNVNMAAALFRVVFFVTFVVLAVVDLDVVEAYEFKVGGSEGWRVPFENESTIYGQWAARNRFQIGDSLAFESTNDSVLMVDKYGYYHCNTSNPLFVYTKEKTVIVKLDHPGLFYFITRDSNQCKLGQRLIVDVMTPHHHHHEIYQSPPSIALPPHTYRETAAISPSPSPVQSSGVLVSVSMVFVFAVLVATNIVVVAWV